MEDLITERNRTIVLTPFHCRSRELPTRLRIEAKINSGGLIKVVGYGGPVCEDKQFLGAFDVPGLRAYAERLLAIADEADLLENTTPTADDALDANEAFGSP